MVFKATVVLVVGGLTGSGLVALTSSLDESQPTASARQEIAEPTGAPYFSDETNQPGYIQARFAAQRPFGSICSVPR